jgi:hypothetical protein
VDDRDCSDGRFCNGIERCVSEDSDGGLAECAPSGRGPCARPELCDEAARVCLPDCRRNADADGDTHDDERCGGTDCDDSDWNVYRGAAEVCDLEGRDEDCDGATLHNRDQRDGDVDGDDHVSDRCCNLVTGDDGRTILRCGDDCDDQHADINPRQLEALICDYEDSDCDGDGRDCMPCTCTLANAQIACPEKPSSCRIVACHHGYASCDGDELNGCETDVSTESHCGGCGQACPANADCVAARDGHRCVCNQAFVALGALCADENECAHDNGGCDSAARCDNTIGGRTCDCGGGYGGDGEGQGGCVPAFESLTLSDGVLVPALDPNTAEYEVELPLSTQTITLTPVVNDDVTIEIDGREVSSGVAWQSPVLSLGPNRITLTLDEVGRARREYAITVHRGYEQGYLKASNTGSRDNFGQQVAISGDTIVIGAMYESSSASGVDGDETNDGAHYSGAAYVFVRNGGVWSQQAYLKASNTFEEQHFGASVAISGDTVVIGAPAESSAAAGIDGNQAGHGNLDSGAAYVFVRVDGTWSQEAYVKASNAREAAEFGASVAIDGDTMVVGATGEASAVPGWTATPELPEPPRTGAAYVFVRAAGAWSEQATLKASNAESLDGFGHAVAIAGDTIVVGAPFEDSAAIGVDGDASDNTSDDQGAVYAFVRTDRTWSQQVYLKPIASTGGAWFGYSVGLAGDTVVVGAPQQHTVPPGVEPTPETLRYSSGAAHVFARRHGAWAAQAMITAANADAGDSFGWSVAMSERAIVVGAPFEDGAASGIHGDPANDSAESAGACYVFVRSDGSWSQAAYLKPSNTETASLITHNDTFGWNVAISDDTIVAGAPIEDSSAVGVDGDGSDNGAFDSGAAYVFR